MEKIKKYNQELKEEKNIKQNKFSQFFLKELSSRSKKVFAILLILFGSLFALGIYLLPFDLGNKADETSQKEEEIPRLTTPCPLTGEYVTEEAAKQRPFGIMIENSTDARPQSGLDKADLVYEVVTEGGITRFLAFFQCDQVDEIGPVRSSRIYYLDWVAELSAFYTHAGGSPDSLARISRDNVLDLNHATNYFWRSNNRPAPHNLYTSIAKLIQYAKSKKYNLEKSDFNVWTFKDDIEESQRPESFSAKIHFSSASYLVEYIYNQDANNWTRKIAGSVHQDVKTKEAIQVKNVVVQFTQIIQRSDNRVDVATTGTGDAIFLINGQKTQGTWRKSSVSDRTKYFDSVGKEIEFSRGPIWVEVVQIGTKVE